MDAGARTLHCAECGAPLDASSESAVVCPYCGTNNAPLAKAVQVPVPVVLADRTAARHDERDDGLRFCPHDNWRLDVVRLLSVELAGCQGCGGVWIDNASAAKIVAEPRSVFAELAVRCAKNARLSPARRFAPKCPECGGDLERVAAYGLRLDVCREHGTWFDRMELDALVGTLRGEPREGEPLPDSTRVDCVSCGTNVARERANVTGDGLVCEVCWRKLEAEQRARPNSPDPDPPAIHEIMAGLPSYRALLRELRSGRHRVC